MSSQIKPSVTNPSISDVYGDIQSGRLLLAPDFQRKFVWTHEHQEQFIDTILKGFPFPEIYVSHATVDVVNLKTVKQVIDGQQRLTTIVRYIEGAHAKPLTKVTPYSLLSPREKEDFLSYQIVVRDLGKVDDETVREIFRRINLTKFQLENVEIHNAIYDGEFIQTAKRILERVPLRDYGVLKESEFTRMADLHFILLVMATLEHGGYFAQDKEVETKIAEFNDEYERADYTQRLLLDVFAIITGLDLPPDSIWFRKSNFFTLVVELARNILRLPGNLRERLLALEAQILANKQNSDSPYGLYYSYMYQATHGRTARVTRSELFCNEVLA